MAESQIVTAIRVWAAVAWADGKLADAEADGLRRLIRSADLTTEERSQAAKLLDKKVDLPDAYLTNLNPDARRGVYRAACRMAVVDHMFTATERALLDRLRILLGVPAEIAMEIEADIPGIP